MQLNSSIDRAAEADVKPEMSVICSSSPTAEWPTVSTAASSEYPPRQQCASCLRPVGRDELVRRVAVAPSEATAGRREVSVHVRCLRCAACERELCTGERAYVLAGQPLALALYCEPDYERLAATVAATTTAADVAIASRGTHCSVSRLSLRSYKCSSFEYMSTTRIEQLEQCVLAHSATRLVSPRVVEGSGAERLCSTGPQ